MFGPFDMMQKYDEYQKEELQPSWSNQLDTVGMQPHAREYLERQMTSMKGQRTFVKLAGQMIDYPEGIQFSDEP